jgi:hypothetical protein
MGVISISERAALSALVINLNNEARATKDASKRTMADALSKLLKQEKDLCYRHLLAQ